MANITKVLIQEISHYCDLPEHRAMNLTCKNWYNATQKNLSMLQCDFDLSPGVKKNIKKIFNDLGYFRRLPKFENYPAPLQRTSIPHNIARATIDTNYVRIFVRLENRGAPEPGESNPSEEFWTISDKANPQRGVITGGGAEPRDGQNYLQRLVRKQPCGLIPSRPGQEMVEIGSRTVTGPDGKKISRIAIAEPFEPVRDTSKICSIQ